MLTPVGENQIFASILSDGNIHITVPEETEGAVLRKYKTSDGKEGQKWERVYKDLVGKITKINFRDGDFGTSLQITVTDKEEVPVTLSMPVASNYAEDIMKKLPNVNLEKLVKLAPYSFKDDKGKSKKGITVWQYSEETNKNEKITNYYYDEVAKKNIHGYPEPKKTKKPLTKDQWKLYFAECRQFLVEETTERFGIEEQKSDADKDFDLLIEDALPSKDEEGQW